VTISQIAKGLSVSRQRADVLSRYEGFPKPASESVRGRAWDVAAIRRWAKANDRTWVDPK